MYLGCLLKCMSIMLCVCVLFDYRCTLGYIQPCMKLLLGLIQVTTYLSVHVTTSADLWTTRNSQGSEQISLWVIKGGTH